MAEGESAMSSNHNRRRVPALVWLMLVALFLVYAIQLRSPLRLNTDADVILRLTANLTDGQPYLYQGHRPLYPIGMPLFYSFMERAGMANSFGFGLLNLLCLFIAALAIWVVSAAFRMSSTMRATVILVAFSSYVLIKHSVLPLTDIPYLAVSMAALALLETIPEHGAARRLALLALAFALVAAAMLIRRIGVALVPAAIYAAFPAEWRQRLLNAFTLAELKRRWPVVVGVVIILAILVAAHRLIFYLPDLSFQGSITHVVARQVRLRLMDFGDLILNLPLDEVARLRPALDLAGLGLTALMLIGLWRWRQKLHPTHVYLIAYLAILAIWPFTDVRFWIPVLPLIVIVVIQSAESSTCAKACRRATAVYLAYYTMTVVIAVAYTTRLTFAGSRFPERYGGGSMKAAYEEAWSGQVEDPNDDRVNLIHRYGMEGAPAGSINRGRQP